MGNAWLIRPSPSGVNRTKEFLAENVIAIGWCGVGDLSGNSREDLKILLTKPPYSLRSLALGNTYATMDIFANQMKIGDLVLVADNADIYFCIIKSEYNYVQSKDVDKGYPHQRCVEWLERVGRNDLPMELRKSLKVHRTTANLTPHLGTIKALAYGEPLKESVENRISDTVSADYPLRKNLTVTVTVPCDMTKSEAERLGDFVKTLYYI